MWVSWHLIFLIFQYFAQNIVEAYNKENIKAIIIYPYQKEEITRSHHLAIIDCRLYHFMLHTVLYLKPNILAIYEGDTVQKGRLINAVMNGNTGYYSTNDMVCHLCMSNRM